MTNEQKAHALIEALKITTSYYNEETKMVVQCSMWDHEEQQQLKKALLKLLN